MLVADGMRSLRWLFVPPMALVALSCGGPKYAADSRPDFGRLDMEDRVAYMAEVVTPEMADLLAADDPEAREHFGCASCHGDGFQQVRYRMPNGLLPLDPEHMPSADSDNPREARVTRFMQDVVTPRMAELLGEEPYDPETGQGLGCFACHARVR